MAESSSSFDYGEFLGTSKCGQLLSPTERGNLEISVSRQRAVTATSRNWTSSSGKIQISLRRTSNDDGPERSTTVTKDLDVGYSSAKLNGTNYQQVKGDSDYESEDEDVSAAVPLLFLAANQAGGGGAVSSGSSSSSSRRHSTTTGGLDLDEEGSTPSSSASTSSSSRRYSKEEIESLSQQIPRELSIQENTNVEAVNLRFDNVQLSPGLVPVLAAYLGTAVKSLVSNLSTTSGSIANSAQQLGLAGGGAFPLKVSGFGPTDFAGAVEGELTTHVGLLSLASSVGFIGSIRGLNSMKTAKQGNVMGMAATAMGLLSVLASPGFGPNHLRFLSCFLAAGGVGYTIAESVAMEDMPQLVAGFHSFVGLAAVLVGFANHFDGAAIGSGLQLFEEYFGVGIGALTFTGSVVAAGKLHGVIPGAPLILENRWALNGLALGSSALMGLLYVQGGAGSLHSLYLLLNAIAWAGLGVNLVLPVGGADMPVVVSLLNSFSGVATAASGFMLRNDLLTITGALVASSGALLSDIMCKGINRSLTNVLIGGFGVDSSAAGAAAAGGGAGAATAGGTHRELSYESCAHALLDAKKIVIVPGYGLAVARAQQKLQELVEILRGMRKTVHFAIHPVAGRLPGHMNVLLAEANVPYEIVREMDEINDVITTYDVAIVIGANDIVNPATQSDVTSPIYGMPAIEIWKVKQCVVLKRSMATGYSGVDNPLFYLDNVQMLFGDARASTEALVTQVNEKKEQRGVDTSLVNGEPESEEEVSEFVNPNHETDFPVANKVLGFVREVQIVGVDSGASVSTAMEKRVAITPAVVPKLRKLGFRLVMEAGSGDEANYPDSAYAEKGGVEIVATKQEVLSQASVIVKVSEPLPEELSVLSRGQIMAGIWGMYGKESIIEQAKANTNGPVVFNMALIPRISRAQALDVLSSMANIAGYRAVLDAFQRYPRFAKPSTTASGNTPPAKVFIIGAGVAGLSAIATAHALGAKVYASDVRSAAKEQVESMGAEFVEVQGMIQGEGAGGYARDMGEEFKIRQKQMYAKYCKECDIVITTALIPGRSAPIVITKEMVQSMKRGSVVVDLAALNGGNCEITRKDEVVVTPSNAVTVIGKTNYPSEMAPQASDFLARNFLAFLDVLCQGDASNVLSRLNLDDQIVRDSMIVHENELMYPPPAREQPVQHTPAPVAGVGAASATLLGTKGGSAGSTTVGGSSLNESQMGGASPTPGSNPALNLSTASSGSGSAAVAPGLLVTVLDWMSQHSEELAMFLGTGVLLALGLGTSIPPEEITHLGYFVLSLMIGNFTVASVTPALHTPLISVTNAISGIIVIGGMLQLGGPMLSAKVACAMLAIFFSSVNIVGGFAVTARMLDMFRSETTAVRKLQH